MPIRDQDRSRPLVRLLAAAILVAVTGRAASAELLAGWAAGDLTPARPVSLQGQHRLRVSRGVRDPLTCTALALESVRSGRSVEHVVFVSCDLANVSPELLDALATHHAGLRARAVGLDPARIFVNATHTHTGPRIKDTGGDLPAGVMQPDEYLAFAATRIAAAVEAAWNGRRPATASWALAHAAVAHNRRVAYFDPATGRPAAGRTTMYGRTAKADFDAIEGPADTGLPLVFLGRPDGGLTGVIVNLSCPAQETEQLEEVSADFWHEARLELRKLLGPDVFVLPQCGAAGDCTSRAVWRTAAEAEMRRRRGLSAREEIARRIAAAVADVLPVAAAGLDADPVLAHAMRTIDLPQRLVTPEERDRATAAAATATTPEAARWHRRVADRGADQQAAEARGEPTVVPVTVHAVRLGDVAFVTNPFELFGDYGARIQARSPAAVTAVVQLAGRGTAGTYLPTARAVEGAGYSAIVQSNLVGPAGGRVLVDASVRLLESLWSRPAAGGAPDAASADGWDEDVGLWALGGHDRTGTAPVHAIRNNAWRLVAAGLDGELDRVPTGRVLRRLREAQERQGATQGTFRWLWEDDGVRDPNGGFFTVLGLLALRLEFADRLSAADRRVLDDMLAASRPWFLRQTEPLGEDRLRYPNCVLGNVVCRWLLMELFDSHNDPATEAALGQTLDALAKSHWGWGEHLSDVYAKVCQAELVMLLTFARRLPPAAAARADSLLGELDAIDAAFAGGPRVPTIRCYALADSPATPRDSARHSVVPFRELMASATRRMPDDNFLLAARLAARRDGSVRPAPAPAARERDLARLEIACHGGARALARIAEDWRLGVLTRYPLMKGVDNPAWGLHWQSMPVAFHRRAGDWGFLQWVTEEGGGVRALPALARTTDGPRVLSELHPVAAVGHTFGSRRGDLFLAVRRLDAVAPSWPWARDRFRIVDATCSTPRASRQDGWTRLDLPYDDGLTLTLGYRPLAGDVTTRLESPAPGTWHWEQIHAWTDAAPPRLAGLWVLAMGSPPAALPDVTSAADRWRLTHADGSEQIVMAFAGEPFDVPPAVR